MVKLTDAPVILKKGAAPALLSEGEAVQKKGSMAWQILKSHNTAGDMDKLRIRFDKLTSHDITYVGIIQTARASGLERFPMPYVLTNCHNSLCAVGGTINEDDHVFGLTCARKYGGVYVPPHLAVIHQYAREMLATAGGMILGSDSHTRYGALGCMAVGEGGPELVKQLLNKTYDIDMPEVICVYLTGKCEKGVGPQDVALALIGAVFKNGFVKNKVLEFTGPGVDALSADFRIGIDVMTTETTCLSSIWHTDSVIKDFYEIHGRGGDYKELSPEDGAYYDGLVEIDLSAVRPMIAMPFHPSNVYTIDEVNENTGDILAITEENAKVSLEGAVEYSLMDKIKNGRLCVDQGVIAGCAGGGFENIADAADILSGRSCGNGEFSLNVYPASQPIYMEMVKNGIAEKLMASGAVLKTAFCGPCFGAGDTPANNSFSIRHSTRNFPNREGSKLQSGQIASVALMDARSIAATAANGGVLTSACDFDIEYTKPKYFFDGGIYEKRVYDSKGVPDPDAQIKQGPNIKDWPQMNAPKDNLLLRVVSVIMDPVTTTDELIPSGETSSYRSNPEGLAEFTLSRKDPEYVGEAKKVRAAEQAKNGNKEIELSEAKEALKTIEEAFGVTAADISIGSTIYARKPGDGSAREQAASCQKVLGGWANIAEEYATKRYRSNLINWGMLPLLFKEEKLPFEKGAWIFIPDIRTAVAEGKTEIEAFAVSGGKTQKLTLGMDPVTDDEKDIILKGCLINYYRD